jgi:hypothetical protein
VESLSGERRRHVAGSLPTHRLVLAEKGNTKSKTKVGVGWQNAQGWISIKLSPGAVISHRDCHDHYLSLYPVEEPQGKVAPQYDEEDDDIPF